MEAALPTCGPSVFGNSAALIYIHFTQKREPDKEAGNVNKDCVNGQIGHRTV